MILKHSNVVATLSISSVLRRFNLEKAHIILDEMVLDGCIVDTNKVWQSQLQPPQYCRLTAQKVPRVYSV